MDPRRTPKKVLMGHLCDQLADFAGNPRAPAAPATPCSISPSRCPAVSAPAQDRLGLQDHQAFTPLRPPARQQDPKQPINAPEARATSSAALQHGNLMAQRDRFQQQRLAGPRFASSDRTRSTYRLRHAPQAIVSPSKPPTNSRGL